LDHGTAVTATHLLVAVGRKPPATDLALGAVGVDVDDRGYIRTDNHLATSARGIYAAGDVTGRMQLTHAAHAMAASRRATHSAIGQRHTVRAAFRGSRSPTPRWPG
jgi:pyruvate/2-oxoglutarate dehydrogenase complex dihydrolipoamide dehydrogenase (E3) component